MQIVAIDTDLLASDNTQTAPITWISKQLLNANKKMYDEPAINPNWADSDIRTYLRNIILPILPSVVQNGIKEVTKYTNQKTGTTTFTTINSTENIWLPSYREISNDTSHCETSGVQYNSIFTDNASRVKSKVGASGINYWLRSVSEGPDSGFKVYFATVHSDGGANYGDTDSAVPRGVAIGFCT